MGRAVARAKEPPHSVEIAQQKPRAVAAERTEAARQAVLNREPSAAPIEPPAPRVESASDFIRRSQREVQFLLPGLLPVGALAMLQGAPGVGKTWLLLEFAKQVLDTGKRVLLVEEEGSAGGFGGRLRASGLEHDDVQVVFQQGVKLTDEMWTRWLASLCSSQRIDLLLLDPLAQLHDGDENEARDMSRLLTNLRRLQREVPGLTIVLAHHTTKSTWEHKGARVADARGSSALTGAADVVLGLEGAGAGTGCVTQFRLHVLKAREFERPSAWDLRFHLNEEGQLDVDWSEAEGGGQQAPRRESDDELDARALTHVPTFESGHFITKESLRAAVSKGSGYVNRCVERLLASGKVEQVPGKGLRRVPEVQRAPGEEG